MLLLQSACGDPVLWKFVDADVTLRPTPQSIASETVEIDERLLRRPSLTELRISLPRGAEIVAVKRDLEEVGNGRFIWRGVIADEPGSTITLAFTNGVVVGNIHTARGAIYGIRHVEKGVSLVEELEAARFPPEERPGGGDVDTTPASPIGLVVDTDPATGRIRRDLAVAHEIPHAAILAPGPGPAVAQVYEPVATPLSSEVPAIDVIVFYTEAALEYEKEKEPILTRIDQLISDSNKSFTDGQVHQKLRLVHSEMVEYTEKDNLLHDLQSLKAGQNDSLGKKLTYGADVVVLLTKPVAAVIGDLPTDSCGQADQMISPDEATCTAAYAVVPINCAANRHSFAHEIGHLMGARHSKGFASGSGAWYTLMAYPGTACVQPDCQRILHWSNPKVEYKETTVEATGTAMANNAESLNEPGDTVAKYSEECDSRRQQ